MNLSRSDVARYYAVRVPAIRQTQAEEWRGPCPIHRGERDSFAIDAETGRWFCHSECNRGGDLFDLERALTGADFPTAKRAILDLLGRAEESPRNGATARHVRSLGPVVAEYIYTDEQGAVLFRVTRHDPKDFRQWRPDGNGGWIPGLGNTRRVLYRLREVIEAPIVFIVEGEKDVESLRAAGFAATCCPMGAGKWRAEYNQIFRGKMAIVIPDDDAPGRAHARQVIAGVKPFAANVIFIDLEDSKDISEWFERGHGELELIAVLEGGWMKVGKHG